jgi:hypothetical protein
MSKIIKSALSQCCRMLIFVSATTNSTNPHSILFQIKTGSNACATKSSICVPSNTGQTIETFRNSVLSYRAHVSHRYTKKRCTDSPIARTQYKMVLVREHHKSAIDASTSYSISKILHQFGGTPVNRSVHTIEEHQMQLSIQSRLPGNLSDHG